jgi:uncharacterized protein (DUF1778 family)
MVTVTVSPINTINVRVNPQNKQVVSTTAQFVGAGSSSFTQELQAAFDTANTAVALAQNAYNDANTKLNLTGGTITGQLEVTGNVITDTDFVGVIDAGSF